MDEARRPPHLLAQAWRRRLAREREELAAAESRARTQAQACAQLLADRYDACTVYLMGSLAGRRGFHAASDIDLAVRGLPESHYLEALDALYAVVDRDVDLVRLEEATQEMADHVIAEGELLYERAQVPATDR